MPLFPIYVWNGGLPALESAIRLKEPLSLIEFRDGRKTYCLWKKLIDVLIVGMVILSKIGASTRQSRL